MIPPRAYLTSLESIGIKLGLDQIHALLAALGAPDHAYPSVIIAGTNGKGSVSAMVERGLRAAGLRTGRYTSPHLVAIEERVAIDGEAVAAGVFDQAAERLQIAAAALAHPPSFFEATTAIALDLFRQAGVDIAVLEVGLGGRLDATNAVPAIASAITAIDFDHQEYLGGTIEAIAAEKAGVIKPGGIAVLGRNPPIVRDLVERVSAERGARYVYAPDRVECDTHGGPCRATLSLSTPGRRLGDVTLALRGRHQIDNAVTAVALLDVLAERGTIPLPDSALRVAVEQVVWPARLELVEWPGVGSVLIDGAHNPAGATALASYVSECYGRPLPFVIAAMRDKDVDGIIGALARVASHMICTAPHSSRAMDPAGLARRVAEIAPSITVDAITEPAAAIAYAVTLGAPVVVAGSLYLAGAVRAGLA